MDLEMTKEQCQEEIRRLEYKMKLMEERYRILAETTQALLFEYSPESDTMVFSYNFPDNKERRQISHYLEFLKRTPLVHPDHVARFTDVLLRACRRPTSGELEYLSKVTSEEYQWHKTYYSSIVDATGKVSSVLGRIHNIHESAIQMEDMISRLETDVTTGLLNKDAAKKRIERWLLDNATGEAYMVMIDLDNFKAINDTYGHSTGDEVLKEFSELLQEHFGYKSLLARFGGDEFFVFITGSILYSVENQVDFFLTKLAGEFTGMDLPVECSIGITTRQDRDDDFEDMFNRADSAMYMAKKAGKNSYHVYR